MTSGSTVETREGLRRRGSRSERIIAQSDTMIDEHHVAQCDADLELWARGDRYAQGERQRVARIPLDAGNRSSAVNRWRVKELPDGSSSSVTRGKPNDMSVRWIRVARR